MDVKDWYNGYSFGGKERLYNPFSLLNFMQDGYFGNYWFHTGTPTFLVERMKATDQFTIDENQYVPLLSLSSFDERLRNIKSVLFQTGYLTLKEINFEKNWCKLQYPNKEVQASLEQFLIDSYRYEHEQGGLPLVIQMSEALNSKDVEEVIAIINSVFSTIPYDLWRGASELHYHALVHLTFSLLGNYVQSEVHSSKGRCDAVVQTNTHVYALEFKLDKSAVEALEQNRAKGVIC
ncbi:MAG: AAA family ATPase, partial [Saprospiraceae bacterium]|nr:AAA family ATPase [Saprospiraceae bacterium]